MRIIQATKYVADDGREFFDEDECLRYEEELAIANGQPRWVVSDNGEFGVRVGGVNYFYYKENPPAPNRVSKWRFINKREFDEVIRCKELVTAFNIIAGDCEDGEDEHRKQDEAVCAWANGHEWKEEPTPAILLAT